MAGAPSRAAFQDKLAQWRARQGRYAELLTELTTTGQTEASLTDADSRGMKRVGVGYNVQVAVDAKHHLVVAANVVQAANDLHQLCDVAVAAKTELAVKQLQAVADAGYHEAQQLEACEAAGIETYVPAPGTRSGQSPAGRAVYPKSAFTYAAATDTYCCPGGHELARARTVERRGKVLQYYQNRAACRVCPLRAACTTAAARIIERLANEAVVERQAARVAAQPDLVARRKELVEHVFGTLRLWGHDDFLLKGLSKVRAEFSLSALSYNLRRVLNLLGVGALLAALRGRVAVT